MIPKTQVIFEEIVDNNPDADINEIHGLVWERIVGYVRDYFARKVDPLHHQKESSTSISLLKPSKMKQLIS